MKKILLAILLIGTLAGCGQQASSQPKKETKVETPAPQPPPNTDKEDMANYYNKLNDPFNHVLTDIKSITDLASIGANNEGIIYTQAYRDRVLQVCSDMQDNIQNIKDIIPPDNPKILAIHNVILQGMEQVQFVADNFPTAINTVNISLINSCTDAFNNATGYFNQATNMVKDINQGDGL